MYYSLRTILSVLFSLYYSLHAIIFVLFSLYYSLRTILSVLFSLYYSLCTILVNVSLLTHACCPTGMIVTKPGMKPCSIRADQLDRDPLLRARNLDTPLGSSSAPDESRQNKESQRNRRDCPRSETKRWGGRERVKQRTTNYMDDKKPIASSEPANNETLNCGYPVIVHFGIRPSQLSYAGNPT